jgi:hypothetical protein
VFHRLGPSVLFHHVLYHEIGHFVFYFAIGSNIKKLWVTEIFPHSNCVTAYAEQSASEDFAETYAAYLRDPAALKDLPQKEVFMRECVFSGRPETMKEKDGAPAVQKKVRSGRVLLSA